MNIGYVGLGNMGGALARRLMLSRQLMIFDRNPQSMAELVGQGAEGADSLKGIAEQCSVIFLCLPTSEHVQQVIFGEGGIAENAVSGTVIVDQTTGDPRHTRTMATELSRMGISLIDAPVSGGSAGADAGTIAIMVGSANDRFESILPILSSISCNVFRAGDVGAGHTMKLVNNLLSTAQRLLSMEAMALAAKSGVDTSTALEILTAGGGRNSYLKNVMASEVLTGRMSAGFTLGLAHKDVRLACQLGIDSGVPMFFGNLTREMYQTCISFQGPDARVDTAALVIDRLAGTSVVPARN